jgi:hypothetical protein
MYNKAGKCCQMSPISLLMSCQWPIFYMFVYVCVCVCVCAHAHACAHTWLTRPGWSGMLHVTTHQQQMFLNLKVHDTKHLKSTNALTPSAATFHDWDKSVWGPHVCQPSYRLLLAVWPDLCQRVSGTPSRFRQRVTSAPMYNIFTTEVLYIHMCIDK